MRLRGLDRVTVVAACCVLGAGVTGVAGATPALAQIAGTPTLASATVRDASGATVGTATFRPVGSGVAIAFQGRGLPAGQHGIHIHEAGRCDTPDFATAGGHLNPASKQHGLSNPNGPHAGDLPNLTVAANGQASFSATDTMVTLGSGDNSLLRPGGTALVIHAGMDDEMTDPAGNSGARIACGVIVAGAAALPNTGGVPAAALRVPLGAAAGGAIALAGLALRRRRRATS